MKRSEINVIIQDALTFLQNRRFLMPPFATWTPSDWQLKGPECRDIVRQQLGWDITDFGSNAYMQCGLMMFTIRNGSLGALMNPLGKVYAKKV